MGDLGSCHSLRLPLLAVLGLLGQESTAKTGRGGGVSGIRKRQGTRGVEQAARWPRQECPRTSLHCKGPTAIRTKTHGHGQAKLITIQRSLTMAFHGRSNAFVRTNTGYACRDLLLADFRPHGYLPLHKRNTLYNPARLPTAAVGKRV